ncbi:MAG: FtsX-like permease family protein [Chloroflexi bacterium]|nr:FtsX-like permease family protein [Chloroflexota bacterium]
MLNFLAWRNLIQHRTRTILSVLAVALGAAMIVAGDWIASAIFSAHQKSGAGQNVEFFAEMFDFGLGIVGVAILVAAGFLVFNAFAMAITQRKRQIGALRSLGMTRSQVMQLVLVEALLTGGIGTLLGLAAGPLLGSGLIALLEWAGELLDTTLAVFGEPSVSLSSFVIATALGVGITSLSVLIPARQATRISPLVALRQEAESGIERTPIGRMLVGLTGMVALTIYLVIAPPGEWVYPPWDAILSGLFTLLWLACLGLMLPALVSAVAGLARKSLSRRWGATGRLVADNLRRNRRRVILTILTLVVGLTMIVSMTGLISFIFSTLLGRMIESTVQQDGWLMAPLDVTADMTAAFGEMDLEAMDVPPDLAEKAREVVGDRAAVGEWTMVVVPELSFLPGWNSYIGDAKELPDLGAYGFTFTEGDWETALPIMESGCSILMTPLVARNNDVWLGDTFTVQGRDGSIECMVAGLGSHPVSGNASFISLAVRDSFVPEDRNPTTVIVAPYPGVDREQLDAELDVLLDTIPNVWPNRVAPLMESAGGASDSLTSVMNSMLLLAILAATLGVVNTTMMNVHERQRELGLLRAVGATRRQVSAVVTGEVALMGFIGGVVGLVAGVGITVIFATTYGGNAWGVPDLNVWDAAWEAARSALSVGLFGLIAAPFISAWAARLPARSILRGPAIRMIAAIRTMEAEQQPEGRRPKKKTRMRAFTWAMAWRNLVGARVRTILSVLAVALGVMMIIVANVMGRAIRSAGTAVESGGGATFMGDMLDMGLTIVGLVILAAASFLVVNAFAMAVTQRQRQVGALRALGMTRRQVMQQFLAEALITGGMGTITGLVIGPLLGRGLVTLLGRMADVAYGESMPSLGGALLAAGAGTSITLFASLFPAWRATRISPLAALRPQMVSGDEWAAARPALGGFAGLAVMAAYLIVAPPGEWVLPPVDGILIGLFALIWFGCLALILPALIGGLGRFVHRLMAHLPRLAATGRLMADNLGRNRRRVTLTILTLAVGLMAIVSLSGILTFMFKTTFAEVFAGQENLYTRIVMPLDMNAINWGAISEWDLGETILSPQAASDIRKTLDQRANIAGIAAVAVPEISVVSGYPSYVMDVRELRRLGWFTFYEGDWQTAVPTMESGCGLLLTPRVARSNGAWLGDHITLQGHDGPVECTVAGLGTNAFFGTSIISFAAGEDFGANYDKPFGLLIQATPEVYADPTALAQFEVDLDVVVARHPGISLVDPSVAMNDIDALLAFFQAMLNGPLLLAILAAALGVINTTVMSVTERRYELGLLRAVGATRRQVIAIVTGEAALMGIVGGGLGSVAGVGLVIIVVVVGGGSGWGVRDLALWPSAWASAQPAILNGLFGFLIAPLICAWAALLPSRSILRGAPIETMEAERQPEGRRPTTQISMRSINFLAWRNLEQGRTRAILSALAVALGAAMIVASSVMNSGVRNAWAGGESAMSWVADMIDVMFTSVGVIILAAAGFLIFNAFAMAVTQQRRQIGALRSLGMTRRQVMRQVLVEALVTGTLGTLVGLAAGPMFGRGILMWMKQMDLDVGSGSVSPMSVLLATVMGLGVTLLSALIPARRATRVSPLTAIREHEPTGQQAGEAASRRTRARVGLAMLGGMAVYLIIAPPGEWSGGAPPWEWIMWLFLWSVWLLGGLFVLPTLVVGLTRLLRAPLNRFGGTIGRLIADNLERAPRRVALTVLTFAVGLTMIVGVGGLLAFSNGVLVMRTAEHVLQQTAWFVYSFDRTQGMAQLGNFDTESLSLEPAIVEDIRQIAAGRADVDEIYLVLVPEISSVTPGFPSNIASLNYLTRPDGFRFIKGDWETALPMMESGCGVLVPPGVTARHKAGIGDTLIIQGRDGPVECQVAGIGIGEFLPLSIIGIAAKQSFLPPDQSPATLNIHPLPGVDVQALEADLYALSDRYGDKVWISKPEDEISAVTDTSDQLQGMLNGLLLLAEIAAALGMVNTTVMSIAERRRELGLLRAVGATRRQVTAVILSEAALMGFIGAGLGVVAGVGLGAIFALSYGGISFGLVDLPLWEAAGETVLPALRTGWLGFVVAPLLAAGAAYPAIRTILRGSAIETMEPGRQQVISPRRAVAGFLGRGSVRTRFVLGTVALMIVVLAGLIGVVTTHARIRIEEQMHDALRTLVTWNAGMIELSLPEDAETLDLNAIQMGQAFDFDSDMLLQFESLVDGMTDNGLVDFTIADRDDVILISLDIREIGTLAPELETGDEALTYSERESGEWLMYATAPIYADDLMVGSIRLTVDAREIQGFMSDLRNTLAAVGSVIILIVLAISWGMSIPLASLFDRLKQWGLQSRFSLRTQLTVAMVIILILMVGALELVAVPIERHHIEDTLKQGLVAATEWIGQAASKSFDLELSDLSPGETLPFEEMLSMTETLDLARLQELTDQIKSDDAAYVALVDDAGMIILSDQFALIGEEVAVPSDTQIEEATWRDEEIWVTTTPLRRGRGGEQIGALRMGVRRVGLETFLDESRNLFRLTGLIAMLAGVLLAQAIGGAVAAPSRQLVTDARRIEEGDLLMQLDTSAQDELVILATAYNQMVLGLQEREWLRDMFGRFVSREVAEAIRTGQVRLDGENRVVSILFCDIRGFTARSERCTPEEMVALLNEYLPVVVDAAQRHEGTVNKFGGDSTLVVYGAPRQLRESAYQAVLTALEIRASLRVLNIKLTERGESPIRIGVGINTGLVLAGAVGPEERQEYTVIGNTVNLASRIEALNKQYPDHDILISGQTYDALGSRRQEFEFVDLGEIRIQDKVEPVRVWAVRR